MNCEFCGKKFTGKKRRKFCSRACYADKSRRSTEDFIRLAKQVHGDYYDYSRVEYKSDVEIGCPVHGYWIQRAHSHLSGMGCRRCNMQQKYGADHPSRVPAIKAKRQKTFDEKYNGHPLRDPTIIERCQATWAIKTPEDMVLIGEKKQQSYIDRYGYDNPFNDKDTLQKIYQLRTERGDWTDISVRNDFYAYERRVRTLTEKNYRKNTFLGERSYDSHLDHILSVKDGFLQNIAPEIVAHPANLRVISRAQNILKHGKSDIALDDLLLEIAKSTLTG